MTDELNKEEFIEYVLSDLTFQINDSEERDAIKEILGGEEEVLALEDFLKERWYEEADYYNSIKEAYEC